MAVVLGTNGGFVAAAPTADPAGSVLDIDTTAWATKHVAPAGATKVTEIGVYIDNATEAADIDVGIYSHDAINDKPDVLLGSATIAKGTGAGWKVKTGLNIAITPGATYWIAAQVDDTATTTQGNYSTGGIYLHRKHAQTSLTNPWGETTWPNSGIVAAIYAVYTTAVGTNMKINIGDTFKDVDSLKINIGGAWKDVTKVQQNIGGVWKDVFG